MLDAEIFEISGQIDSLGDTDTFELDLISGRQYRVTVTGSVEFDLFSLPMENPRSVAESVYQELLTPVFSAPSGLTSTFVAQPGETYFVDVQSFFTTFVDPLGYVVELKEVVDAELAGVQTDVSVEVADSYSGTFEELGDQDWVRLDITAAGNYLAAFDGAFGDSMLVVGFDSLTGEQVDLPFLGALNSFGTSPQVGFSAQAGVDYYAILQDGSGLNPNYTLSLTSLVGDIASDSSTTLSVDADDTAQGVINALGDYDWVKLNTVAGDSYQVTLSFSGFFASNGYNLIEVDVATGEIIDVVDTPPANFTFSARTGSNYFVEVVPSFGAAANGVYEIGLTTFTDDFVDNTSTTGVLGVNSPVVLAEEALSDFDFVRLDVEAGKSYVVANTLEQFQIVRGDLLDQTPGATDPSITGFDFADPRFEQSRFNFFSFQIEATVDIEAGFDYFLVSSTRSSLPPTFTLTEVTPGTLDHAGTDVVVSPNQTISGVYDTGGDQDWIRLDLDAGENAALTVTNVIAEELELFAVSADGTVEHLDRQNFISGPFLGTTAVTGRADQTLYLQVTSTGLFGSYSISLAPVDDDFSDDPATATLLGSSLIDGTSGADVLDGTSDADVLSGLEGNDTISGLAGDDTLDGGLGSDSILGGQDNDLFLASAGRDTLNGESGDDTVSYEAASGPLLIRLNKQAAGEGADRDLLFDIENVVGSGFDDRIVGNTLANELFSGLGDDTVIGLGGDDTIDTGEGDDSVLGASDNETVLLGDGNDVARVRGGDDWIEGGLGDDTIGGNGGADTAFGGDGNDTFFMGSQNDFAFGGAGEDVLNGGFNADVLDGGADDDRVRGEAGVDQINGGDGNDLLNGGANADTFWFFDTDETGVDRITDFEDGLDEINLSDWGFANDAAVIALASSSGGANQHTRIDFTDGSGGQTRALVIENLDIADFDASDITLSGTDPFVF
ncbi:MAG: calcium-binding protein [Paracoccaceae bacterium]